jgi:restriction system protein
MGRRRSDFNDWMKFASRLAPRTSVIFAIASFLALHAVAVTLNTQPAAGTISGSTAQSFFRIVASFLQYLVPAAFLIGALGSVISRAQGRSLSSRAATGAKPAIAEMSWEQFERLVGEGFRLNGFNVVETGGQGSDGGFDLVLTKDGGRFLVQCKHWKDESVGVSVIRELRGVIAAQGATGGYVVTSGQFTTVAKEFAEHYGVDLIDGEALEALLRDVDPNKTQRINRPSADAEPGAVLCPKCGSSMTRRVARRGGGKARAFWGCSQFPKCRGTARII